MKLDTIRVISTGDDNVLDIEEVLGMRCEGLYRLDLEGLVGSPSMISYNPDKTSIYRHNGDVFAVVHYCHEKKYGGVILWLRKIFGLSETKRLEEIPKIFGINRS